MPREHETTTLEVADNLRSDYKPTNTLEMLGGLLVLVIGALVGYRMFLNHKVNSPTAQAEADLKADLNKELNEFKNSINIQQTQQDSKVTLVQKDYIHLSARMDTYEVNFNQQFTMLHDQNNQLEKAMRKRFDKFEETLITILIEKKS
jgi:hypothetical protein